MNKKRIEFTKLHPIAIFIYLSGILVLTMCCRHPVLLGISLLTALIVNLWLKGFKMLKGTILMTGVMLFFTVGIFPLFSHHGSTPLYYINRLPVTFESEIYGLVMTEMLLAVVLWCGVLSIMIDSEKLLYLVGRQTPAIGLLLTMIFGMVPRLKRQYREIHDGRKGLGKTPAGMSPIDKIRYTCKEISVLISWGLEDSAETSLSMESRGYGVRKRTFFHLYTFHVSDGIWTLFFLIAYGIPLIQFGMGEWSGNFFPELQFSQVGIKGYVGILMIALAGLCPLFTHIGRIGRRNCD